MAPNILCMRHCKALFSGNYLLILFKVEKVVFPSIFGGWTIEFYDEYKIIAFRPCFTP